MNGEKVTFMLGVLGVVVVLCAVAVWREARLVRQASDQMLAQLSRLDVLDQFDPQVLSESNDKMVARLDRIESQRSAPDVPSDQAALAVVLIQDTPDGQPIEKVKVFFSGRPHDAEKPLYHTAWTDASGRADWPDLQPGKYRFSVGHLYGLSTEGSCDLHSGVKQVVEVPCPAAPPVADVRFDVPWPDDLKGKGLIVVYGLSLRHESRIGDQKWRGSSGAVCLADDGSIVGCARHVNSVSTNKTKTYPRASNDVYRIEPLAEQAFGKCWPAGDYGFWHMFVLVPIGEEETTGYRYYRDVWSYWKRDYAIRHVAGVDGPNLWTVPLPESLVEHVRGYLALGSGEKLAAQPESLESIF